VFDLTLKPLIIMPAFVLYAGDGGGFVQAGQTLSSARCFRGCGAWRTILGNNGR
jgi:hypothetical protein